MSGAENRLFCFGLGYSALALAERLAGEGWRIAGTCRGPDKEAGLRARGIEVHPFGPDRPLDDPAGALAGTTHLLSSVPPDDDGDPVLRRHGDDLARLASSLEWVGYLSTTGVYGDRGGGFVDESSALQPSGRRGQARLDAEHAWLELWRQHGVPVHLFRLAGIYGPGRSALDAVRAGTARRIVKPGHVFSRIHVEDIAGVLRASMAQPNPGAAYNVCDDEAAPGHEVVAWAARLLGVAPPPPTPFAEAELTSMARSFYADNKRVGNQRIKSELGVRLSYPDYRQGLAAVLAAEQAKLGPPAPAPLAGDFSRRRASGRR